MGKATLVKQMKVINSHSDFTAGEASQHTGELSCPSA